MAKTVNFRVGRGRTREARKAFSSHGLLAAMDLVGMTDDEKRAALAKHAHAAGAQQDPSAKESAGDVPPSQSRVEREHGAEQVQHESQYLTADHPDAYVDFPTPADKLARWRQYHTMGPEPFICARCKGYGGHNLVVNAYPLPAGVEDTPENRHKYCHLSSSCMQCAGWGYVTDRRDAVCAHEFDQGTSVGHCLKDYTCQKPGCGRVIAIDSSD